MIYMSVIIVHIYFVNHVHIDQIFEKFDKSIFNIKTMEKSLDDLKLTSNKSKLDILEKTNKTINFMQEHILNMCQERKKELFDEINTIYNKKNDEISSSVFRNIFLSNLNELNNKKTKLSEDFKNGLLTESSMINELKNLEEKLKEKELNCQMNLNEAKKMPNLNININESFNVKDMFKNFVNSVNLVDKNNNQILTAKKISKPSIKIEDFIGNSSQIELDYNIKIFTTEYLKERIKTTLGIDKKTFIILKDKLRNNQLSDDIEIEYKDKKLFEFLANQSDLENQYREEIQIVVSYSQPLV